MTVEYSAKDIDRVRDAAPVYISPEGAVDVLVELLEAGWRPPLRHLADGYELEGPVRAVFGELMLHQFGDPTLRGPIATDIVSRLRRDGWMLKDEDERRKEIDEEFDRKLDAAHAEAQRVTAVDAAAQVVIAIAQTGVKLNEVIARDMTVAIAQRFERYVRDGR